MTNLKKIRIAAAGILAFEALVLSSWFAYWIYLVAAGASKSVPTMLAEAAVILIVALWLAFATKALYEGHGWGRSSAVFWQTCQLAVAFGSFTGRAPRIDFAIALIIPSVIVLVLMFSKPVLADAAKKLN